MSTDSIARLSDSDLLDATTTAVAREHATTAELIALLAELDARRLYLGEGFSSLFTYCTQSLHLSEPAAYSRITAARAARRFPRLLAGLACGDITLTTITLLAPELTDENCDSLIDAARHKTKRDVERLIACLHPQPDVPAMIRKVPSTAPGEPPLSAPMPPKPPASLLVVQPRAAERGGERPAHRTPVAPIAADRYLRVTISGQAVRTLERARDLLRPHEARQF